MKLSSILSAVSKSLKLNFLLLFDEISRFMDSTVRFLIKLLSSF